jgi:hypothetical protein
MKVDETIKYELIEPFRKRNIILGCGLSVLMFGLCKILFLFSRFIRNV